MSQENPTLTANCVLCTDPDDGTMVTCSKCLHCFHSSCCNIDDDADVFSWVCHECISGTNEQNASHNHTLHTNNSSIEFIKTPRCPAPATVTDVLEQASTAWPNMSAKKQLQLQQLEEEMQLKQEFLRRKYELLHAEAEECPQPDNFIRPVVNKINKNIDVPPCVQNRQNDKNNRFQLQSTLIREGNCATTRSVVELGDVTHNLAQPQTDFHNSTTGSNDQSRVPHDNCQNNLHDVTQQRANVTNHEHMFANTSNNINNNNRNLTNSFGADNGSISATQLMARHYMPRDLPTFNGDPREWPIFISSFEYSNRVAGYTNDENLVRLQKCLQGKAREAVRNCLMLPEMVPDIIRTLKMYYGRPECIIKNLIDDVRGYTLQRGKLEPLIEFAFAVKNLCATIRASQLEDYLNNPTLLQELVVKLPTDTVMQWALHSRDIARPNLMNFSDWLYMIAEATCKVTIPVFDVNHERKPVKKEGRVNTHTTQSQQQQCVKCLKGHKLAHCVQFKDLNLSDRWDIVKTNNLCRICLGSHRRKCWFTKQCGVNGCTVQHNPLLHSEDQATGGTVNNHRSSSEGESYYRIVPVTLYGDKKSATMYALMDDGSTLTLLEEKVADLLGVKGINDPLCIRWTGDVTRYEDDSRRLNLRISAAKPNSKVYPLSNVYTVKNLNLSNETMNANDMKSKYTYLRDIPLESYANVTPSIIIGINNANLISSMKVREGGWHQPVASKTRLGWTLFGGGSTAPGKLNFHKCNCDDIHGLVKKFFSDENVGISFADTPPMSKEDQQAIDILNKTCTFKDGRYEVGLLWKNDPPELPNSLPTALKRLKCLKQKADRDPTLGDILQQQITNLEGKGYAERLPNAVLEQNKGKIWYLPTFIVRNPQKQKVRLVWDAAAKSGDFALNDFLLKGPDLLMPLMQILFKFRMGAVAICGDIAEMFHRIKVRKEDASVQRFLWFDKNSSMIVYQLNVLTFGASCSPCISHFVRDKNATDFGKNPKVIEAITKQHYVDDFIDSTNTTREAIELALGVRAVHAKGGFHMRNWSSNSHEVLEALGETNGPEQKTFENNENLAQFEKILGLYWDPSSDVFKMNLKFVRLQRPILKEDIVPTKREVLQVLMSVFDPLGFVACFMSYLKSILQEIWRCGIDWDQPLNETLYTKWKNWLTFLPTITKVSIPRWYSLSLQQECYVAELHTFVDASEDAYAAVSYFRIEIGKKVEVRLVAAKAKVAPLRPLSVPRLELQAATIGARLMQTVSCHNIKFQQRVMWTDSKTVLAWLAGDPRKYKQFVMFRISEILKFTNTAEWRWVPSAMNVADFATKFRAPTENYKEWFEGPSWLRLPEVMWPNNCTLTEHNCEDSSNLEIRPRFLNIHTRKSIIITINYEYFSSWYRLHRAVANWVKYVEQQQQRLRQQNIVKTLNASHFIKAKTFILKTAQIADFADEYSALQNGRPISKGGAFDKLNVYLDADDIVRVKNRAQYGTPACGPQRDLIILPGKHHLTNLIVMDYHRAYHHLNHETVLNEIRQVYFILKLRPIFKTVRRNCQQCKIEAAKPFPPQMAPLPPARLGAFQRPFTFVGVDYFGPISVTFGRKSLKRWGVIFTCLTVRAIHIEIAHTLSTDSFLMVLRNFIARRGTPAEIYSDNGTNFRGADRFLRDELKTIKLNDIQTEMASKGISWKFNPPAAPHMGGAWERLIRSIKTILYKISPSQKFTDESLRSALMEVELIVNSRPLTYVSLETEDQEAITPNHFLLGSSNGTKPFCSLEAIDHKMCLRQSETFANQFWRRFVKEMLPTLTRRSKWTQRSKAVDVGDIVLVVDENAERNSWLKGKVIEITRAKDGQVRRAQVKTKNGLIERPAVKLAVLDVGNILE